MMSDRAQLVACALCTRCQAFMVQTPLGWKSSGRCGLGGPFAGYVQADPSDPAPQPRYGPLLPSPPGFAFLVSGEAS